MADPELHKRLDEAGEEFTEKVAKVVDDLVDEGYSPEDIANSNMWWEWFTESESRIWERTNCVDGPNPYDI